MTNPDKKNIRDLISEHMSAHAKEFDVLTPPTTQTTYHQKLSSGVESYFHSTEELIHKLAALHLEGSDTAEIERTQKMLEARNERATPTADLAQHEPSSF